MSNFGKISTYHGTAELDADNLVKGNVDATLGGGELGQGFYLGTELHVAKAWAMQKHNGEFVVEFSFDDDEFWSFDIESLTEIQAIEHRSIIRERGLTRTYKFSKDIVWGPIVGGPKVYADQHKWESSKGEGFLNGDKVLRRIR
ncbi:MAG TPA: hypothetical protein DD411_04975 [Alcanivorax sp.]|jgi:hypothetical protein|nr:hypothetical protein [Alcanivorax sp.]|tara:strand:+ start:938 stop:1369 length:432 start_codon:yes stop_codon:yes gene_type:complete